MKFSQPSGDFFLLFLFAVGYASDPIRPRVARMVVRSAFAGCMRVQLGRPPAVVRQIAGYDLDLTGCLRGQTISAAMGLSTYAINRLVLAAE